MQIKVVTLVIVAILKVIIIISDLPITSGFVLLLLVRLYQVVNHGVLKVGFDRLIRRKNLWILDSCETETTKKVQEIKKYQKQQPLLIVSYYVERYFELTVAVRDL